MLQLCNRMMSLLTADCVIFLSSAMNAWFTIWCFVNTLSNLFLHHSQLWKRICVSFFSLYYCKLILQLVLRRSVLLRTISLFCTNWQSRYCRWNVVRPHRRVHANKRKAMKLCYISIQKIEDRIRELRQVNAFNFNLKNVCSCYFLQITWFLE